MSQSNHSVMVIAGEAGGKTTFLGGLTLLMERNKQQYNRRSSSWRGVFKDLLNWDDGITGEYQVIKGRSDLFEGTKKSVVDRMRVGQYPLPTNQRDYYIIKFQINKNLKDVPTVDLTVMDIPGESQREALQEIRSNKDTYEVAGQDYTKDDIFKAFESNGVSGDPIRDKINQSDPLNPEEWKVAFLYRYFTSNRLLFIVNLQKVQEKPQLDLQIQRDLLEEMSENRVCLLLFTAVDIVDYDPRNHDISNFTGGGIMSQSYDDDLYELLYHTNSALSQRAGNKVLPLADAASDLGMDMFGVAVPSRDANHNAIKQDGGTPVLQGFENVGKWLKQT
jgi:hypothetical protein